MSRLRNVVITVNNPVDNEYKFPEWVSYCVYQLEKGENGTPHHQMYCEFERAVNMSTVKSWLPRAHIERRKGTQSQAIDYCTKEDTRIDGPWEYGEPKRQGARSDLEAPCELIKEGVSMTQIAQEYPVEVVKFHRGFDRLNALLNPPHKRDGIIIHVLWGPPGTGKSRRAHELYPDAYTYVDNTQGWFDGYEGQSVVLMDEFSCETPLRLLLRMFDRYPHRMPIKGGYVSLCATTFVVTSNICPDCWYGGESALQRRLSEFGRIEEVGA